MNSTTTKFCSNCGAEIEIGENFCAGCGTKLAQTDSPSNQQSGQSQYRPQPTAHEKYSKMGGWLLVFTIGSIISIPIILSQVIMEFITLSDVFYYRYTGAGIVIVIAQLVSLCSAVFYILSVVKVFQRKPLFLRLVQIASILITVNYLFNVVAIGMIDTDLLAEHIGTVIGGVIGFFLMTLYYCKSVRVRTYMGSDEYLQKAIFAYKRPPIS